jgi:hypothetical protein
MNTSAQNLRYINQKDSVFKDLDLSGIIPLAIDTIFDAKVFLEQHYHYFGKFHFSESRISFAHSLFGILGIDKSFSSRDEYYYQNYNENKEQKFELLKLFFFKNKSFHEPAYLLIMPYYTKLFSEMTYQEQIAILDMIDNGRDYVENFNLKVEREYAEQNDIAQSKGKMQAFIYRRISMYELTEKECLYWLNKIKKDLSLYISKNKKIDPIVIEKDFSDYYLSRILKYNNNYNEYGNYLFAFAFDVKEIYVIKKGATFHLLDTNVTVAEYIFNYYGKPMVIKKNAKGVDTLELYGLYGNRDEYVSIKVTKEVKKVTALCYEKK